MESPSPARAYFASGWESEEALRAELEAGGVEAPELVHVSGSGLVAVFRGPVEHAGLAACEAPRTLFLARLPPDWKSADLRALGESFAPVDHASVIMDRASGRSKCCGFLKFAAYEGALPGGPSLRRALRPGVGHQQQRS